MTTLESPTREHHPIALFLHLVLGLISILLAAYFGWLTVGFTINLGAYPIRDLMVAVGVLALLLTFTAFFGLVGFRLISGRGAKAGGGLFSPMGYRLTGVVLALLAMLVFFVLASGTATRGINLTLVAAVISLVLFATPSVLSVLCFVAAHRRAKVVSQG